MRPADESPPKPEIERAINRILSKRIEWEITNKNLFADYKISNQYAETGRGYTYFIYEFTAECDVAKDKAFYSGNGRDYWMYQQPDSLRLLLARNPSTKDRSVETQRVTLDGSVTLVKKGVKWYIEETLR